MIQARSCEDRERHMRFESRDMMLGNEAYVVLFLKCKSSRHDGIVANAM
jgi:hypothetical protein